MKATIKDHWGNVVATATEKSFPDYIEKAETGVIGGALAMCGFGMLRAPEFDEHDWLADTPLDKAENADSGLPVVLNFFKTTKKYVQMAYE